jgi:hypothetical protein
MERHDVGLAEEHGKRNMFGAIVSFSLGVAMRIGVEDAHMKPIGKAPGHGLANVAHAYDANGFPHEVGSQEEGRVPTREASSTREPIRFYDAMGEGEDEGDRMFSHRFSDIVARSIGYGDAPIARGTKIDIVESNGVVRDDAHLWPRCLQHLGIHAVGQEGNEAIVGFSSKGTQKLLWAYGTILWKYINSYAGLSQ